MSLPMNPEALAPVPTGWEVDTEIWQLVALLNQYPYALFVGTATDAVITGASLTELLQSKPVDAEWIGPHRFTPEQLIIQQTDLLALGINCQIGAHAVLELLGKPIPRNHRSSEIYGLRGAEYQDIALNKPWLWELGDVVLMKKGSDVSNPKTFHLAVVAGMYRTGEPLLFHVAARRDRTTKPASINFYSDFDGNYHIKVAVARPMFSASR